MTYATHAHSHIVTIDVTTPPSLFHTLDILIIIYYNYLLISLVSL